MKARIFQPSKNAMQSGRGRARGWVLQYERETAQGPEPLMGWTAAGDTAGQIRLSFETLEAAQAYAAEKGLECIVTPSQSRRVKPRNYADNFRYVPPAKTEKA